MKRLLIKCFHCPLNTYYPINAYHYNILRHFKELLSLKKKKDKTQPNSSPECPTVSYWLLQKQIILLLLPVQLSANKVSRILVYFYSLY